MSETEKVSFTDVECVGVDEFQRRIITNIIGGTIRELMLRVQTDKRPFHEIARDVAAQLYVNLDEVNPIYFLSALKMIAPKDTDRTSGT